MSHAAAGYFTSPFSEAAIVVADGVGEWDTFSVWVGRGRKITKVHAVRYPHSLGLLYSAFTSRCCLKPNEEEYILMGMSAYGEPRYAEDIYECFLAVDPPDFRLKENVHVGIGLWRPEATHEDLAASIQAVIEQTLERLFRWVARFTGMRNVVYMGGLGLNCVANSSLARHGLFHNWWIMPNPGDAGSGLGAALALRSDFVEWRGPFLGTPINRPLNIELIVDRLCRGQVVGVANGRAEFGPRALGNRSLLADPRRSDVKARVNDIKRRQRFRPFAPAILANDANVYFNMPVASSPYMQFTAACKDAERFPGISHVDGSARVQTVERSSYSRLFDILAAWKARTGCPMLLNTSLNVRGKPLVNSWKDALEFQRAYGVSVF